MKNYVLLIMTFFVTHNLFTQQGQIIIFITIDQCGQQVLEQVMPYCTGGLRWMYERSHIWNQMYMPHAKPSTAPGHATLATGTVPAIHGIIDNSWCNEDGIVVNVDEGVALGAAVFNPNNDSSYEESKSSNALRVDTLSDQLIIKSGRKKSAVLCVGQKSRSVICFNGKLGLPIWIDQKTGKATSSKAFCKKLPAWLNTYNKSLKIPSFYDWKLKFKPTERPYLNALSDIDAARKGHYYNERFFYSSQHEAYKFFYYMPSSNDWVLSVAYAGLKASIDEKKEQIFLGICLGQPDKMGHLFGQASLEFLDSIYKIDTSLKSFLESIQKFTPEYQIIIALSADHGCMPLPEELNKKVDCPFFAHRISTKKMIQELNATLQNKFGHEGIVLRIATPNLYFNRLLFNQLSKKEKNEIIKATKEWLFMQPYIENAWQPNELKVSPDSSYDPITLFKKQYHPKRSGDILFQIAPYVYLGKHNKGVAHHSPYGYDRHIPFVLYNSKNPRQKFSSHACCATQVAATIAQSANIPLPSCANAHSLLENA